jgi:4-diphosphocytidyl-2-C-methyl-D-erythritol kinase
MKCLYDVPAPAKLNLFLHVIGRRSDGYHLLQSAFMLIDWCDTLHFELRTDGTISRTDLTLALPADDLITRAARALQTATQCKLGAHINIEKHIPTQAGMGGGSSDAASCLLALNRLWQLQLSLSQLVSIGLQLGADVPFFLHGDHAWVEGVGEKIQPLSLPDASFLVIKPPQGLDTKTIFSDPALKRDSPPARIADFAAHPYDFGRNDLQPVALRHCPEIGQAISHMSILGLDGRMTGSGSAVFAHLTDGVTISDAPSAWLMKACKSLKAHPLRGWAVSDD